jgi:hypothetical protein
MFEHPILGQDVAADQCPCSANQGSWILAGGPWSTGLADPLRDDIFPAALKEGTMAEAKLAPNLPDWMVEHANRYLCQRWNRRAHVQNNRARAW